MKLIRPFLKIVFFLLLLQTNLLGQNKINPGDTNILLTKDRTVPSKPSYNYEENYIYTGNYGSATATKIKAFDETLSFKVVGGIGWKWISFPRMERYKDETFDAQTLLSRIKPWEQGLTPVNLYMEYKPQGIDWSISYSLFSGWENDPSLSSLQSTQGYKLKYQGETELASIRLEGAKEDYDTPMEVNRRKLGRIFPG